MLVSFPRTEIVRASGTIYIRADGSIDPSTAPIGRNRDVYTVTDHIYDEIVVERSNIVINGNRFTIQGSGSGRGFNLTSISNVTIKHSNIQSFRIGIHLTSTSHNILRGNNMKNNDFAIWLDYSSNNSISENDMKNNDNGFWLSHSLNNTISRNNIKANNCLGIGLAYSSDNIISGNNIENNYEGIYLDRSSNNIISRNNITANDPLGIWHYRSSNNRISENHIENNYMGVYFWHSSSNIISGNNITESNMHGIYFENVSNNMFYHNNFIDNTKHVRIFQSTHTNFWNNSVEGNYWSNYTNIDLDHDGIGDAPHEIDANNIDNYPLMGMFHNFNTSLGYHVNVVSSSTMERFEYFEFNSTIKMHISNMTLNQAYGFCRICIHYELMNVSSISVVIDNGATTVLHPNYNVYDNGTHRWIYFAYEHSAHKIDIIPEFPSFLILLLFMITTLLTVIMYKRKHVVL